VNDNCDAQVVRNMFETHMDLQGECILKHALAFFRLSAHMPPYSQF
jgi:hypothetical protein